MTQTNYDDLATVEAPPVARTRRRRWTVYLVWLVPLVAAAIAAYLVNDRIHRFGPTITITFQDGTGLKPGQSEIRHRGVSVAEVSALRLSDDRAHVVYPRACGARRPTSPARDRSSGSCGPRSA